MSNIRWYLITFSGQRMLDGDHYAMVLAPDKWSAKDEATRRYHRWNWDTVMSVVEWEDIEREKKEYPDVALECCRWLARGAKQRIAEMRADSTDNQLEMVVAA